MMKNRSQMMERCMRMMKERACGGDKNTFPESMCRSAADDTSKAEGLSRYANSELQSLFEDWLLLLEEEIITFAQDRDGIQPEQVAAAFHLSEQSARILLKKLVEEDKIKADQVSNLEGDTDGDNG